MVQILGEAAASRVCSGRLSPRLWSAIAPGACSEVHNKVGQSRVETYPSEPSAVPRATVHIAHPGELTHGEDQLSPL
jgi:hypothetical protein